jgi:uncharacterized protein YcnI
MKRQYVAALTLLGLFLGAQSASAHVVVRPAQVGIGAFQTFTMSVPNEKDSATVGLKLLIPTGLMHVSPTVKPGWNISTKALGEEVTEISWTGGKIPVGQRDDFTFGVQAPAETGTIVWKAYQTYADGTVVAWDMQPTDDHHDATKDKDDDDSANSGPYSETMVIDDLANAPAEHGEGHTESSNSVPLTLSAVALAFSLIALKQSKKKA